jgi:hypothetical protein
MTVDNPDQRPNSPRRLPWPAVALGTTAFLLLLLTAAVWSDRTLRPRLGPEPTAAATAVPLALATATPPRNPTPTPQPVAVAAPTPVAWWNWRNEVPPDLRDEIWSAYLNYWQVIADGYKSLDTSDFEEVMAGDELGRARKAVNDLSASGKAQDINIDHRAQVVFGTSEVAVVNDEYTSLSQIIDLSTGADVPNSSPAFIQQISFELNKINGVWKVTDAVRYN